MTTTLGIRLIGSAVLAFGLGLGAVHAADDAGHAMIERQKWSFGGMFGHFDRAQVQRGFLVYKEVCSSCHGVKRLSFRNLSEKGGPEFPEDGVKSLAASYQIVDGPNENGKMFKRPGRPSDAIPSPFSNDPEARLANNGALPPDLSVMAKARTVEVDRAFYAVPFAMAKDIATGYQEGGVDYIHALLTGYEKAPASFKVGEGLHYNKAFPGFQIAMIPPIVDGQVKYSDGTKPSIDNYARDIAAFLAWAGDPKLEERKRMGILTMLYLLITTALLYFAKKRVWARGGHGH